MYDANSNRKSAPASAGGRDFVHSIIHFTAERGGQKWERCAPSALVRRSPALISGEVRGTSGKNG